MMPNQRHPSVITSNADEENTVFLDASNHTSLAGRWKPTSILGCSFYYVLLAGYAVLGVGAPWILHSLRQYIMPLLCSCSVSLLVITGIFQKYLVYQIQKICLQGHYILSQKLRKIIKLLYACIVCGTVVMLLIVVWEPHTGKFSASAIIRIVMCVEVVFAGCFLSMYIGYIYRYKPINSQPDILKALYSPLQHLGPLEGLRYYDGGQLSDQHMALFHYQQENIHFLNEEIIRLQECLSKYDSDGRNLQASQEADLAHILSVRDQELRTLSAETNQLQSELRLARSLIAQRDSETQRLRSQYAEENERLRGILREWSARAAKLERALEAQRASSTESAKKWIS